MGERNSRFANQTTRRRTRSQRNVIPSTNGIIGLPLSRNNVQF